ncbi:GAF and ANTAR domain-containing protein [Nocardiopsis rhodophaea]|uniref:GAF and ANTAR domain-containing protein n=1 Tax=Nocardiopsis rhodophaea TaxID=280238 RepID=A0ABP5EQ41_9ACTN
MPREQELASTFVQLADTLVVDFDVVDFLHMLARRSVDLLDVDAAGLMLTDHRGSLRFMAASTESARLLELLQLQNEQGPCLEAYRGGHQVSCPDLSQALHRWPRFAQAALGEGYSAIQAVPMRMREHTVGALNLLRHETGRLTDTDIAIAQGLADVATISILNSRTAEERERLAEQLQTALNSRVVIEQAKGVLSERRVIDMNDAFGVLRGFAREHNRRLSEVARAVVTRDSSVATLLVSANAANIHGNGDGADGARA